MEAIMTQLAPAKRNVIPTPAKLLTANWQTGLEAGGHVQRKLRLTFTKVAAAQAA
ncbi:MAG TPA: hypothetical protein VH207_04975 [Chthoniobacterales bacterium]|nr:hypothetical protein [Chthoniobacterales bacterium]